MPGKVNPVIPEMMGQIAIKVMANDSIVAQSAGLGSLELNQFLPLLGFSLIESLNMLANSIPRFNDLCIKGIKANKEMCRLNVENSQALATILVSKLGYSKVEQLVQRSAQENKKIEELLLAEKVLSKTEITELLAPANMYKLGFTDEKS